MQGLKAKSKSRTADGVRQGSQPPGEIKPSFKTALCPSLPNVGEPQLAGIIILLLLHQYLVSRLIHGSFLVFKTQVKSYTAAIALSETQRSS